MRVSSQEKRFPVARFVIIGPGKGPIACQGGDVQRGFCEVVEELLGRGEQHFWWVDLAAGLSTKMLVPRRGELLHRFVLRMHVRRQTRLGRQVIAGVVVNELARKVVLAIVRFALFCIAKPSTVIFGIE